MQIYIINGPNLHNIGNREPDTYGKFSFDEFLINLKKEFNKHSIYYFQSHYEGEIVSKIHSLKQENIGACVINAGAYSHTSVAIRDAISSVEIPFVNVHISNIYKREKFRNNDLIAPVCIGSISGFGLNSYRLAILELIYRHG
ncbi:MAG: type II 3-dehydroquinate dehydratase [Bacteroidales bacterium]|jgi:3-dehydroquinate dehydratase-2|nr:type II 3-dehydroquinate dehydratase [Bacteroidales bacterium]HOL99053.1 type II 3-dehydroquinate dehydratase [Bacteroidales bacterium]HOM37444.1 type II 3-dehydroquinate dehydratase [Bacteroidales bacterium]HPD24912.1 type II 3-dehydroquinate dehydratase [Bacteroidales bacterium]HRT00623.1 type II 3-dehydroquinate dehydratase [Bacteroidales bacterium]